MAEDLGAARLALETDQSDLDKGLDAAEARTRGFLDRTQGQMRQVLGKAVAGFVATGFAAATAQGVQLNQVLNDVQAETNATGDDWASMEAVIRRENGRTTESMDDIGAAVKSMRQDLGLTGAEIDKYADRIFDAGLATKMGATAITGAVDDIGDAYEVDIDRALGSIDQLIASQEKWGGDLKARIAALPELAKGVKGLGGDIDDAIALLNVASARGLDYAEVQKAINAAVGKFKTPPDLKEVIGLQDVHKTKVQLAREEVQKIEDVLAKFVAPEELRTLIAQLDGIEDPTLRAAAAEKIYNDQVAKFNADPIGHYLDLLGQIPDAQARTQKAIEIFGGKAGPIWSELAGQVAKGGGSLADFNITQDAAGHKAEELARDLDNGPIRSLKLLGERVGGLLADAGSNPLVTGVASLGTILGGFAPNLSGKVAAGIAKGFAGAFRKVGADTAVKAAVNFAADQAATVYLKALIAGDAASAGLSAMWRRAATSAPVQAALAFLGQTTAGRILASVGPLAIPVTVSLVVLAPIAQGIQDANQKELHDKLSAALQAGTDEAFQDAEHHLQLLERGARASHNDSWLAIILGEKAAFEAGVRDRVADIKDAGQFVASVAREETAKIGPAAAEGLQAGAAVAHREVSAFAGKVKDDLAGAGIAAEAHRQGLLAGNEVAKGIRSTRDTTDQAWQDMLDGIKNSTSVTARTALLIGRLAGKKLQEGLHDADPAVRAQARYTKQITLDELEQLRPRAGTLSKEAMANLRKMMKSADPDIRAAATSIYNAAVSGPKKLPAAGSTYGAGLVTHLISGMNAHANQLRTAAAGLAGIARQYFALSSPAKEGPWSLGGGPEGWGGRFTSYLARGIRARIGEISAASRDLAGAAAPAFSMPVLTARVALSGASLGSGAADYARFAGERYRPPEGGGVTNNYIQNVKMDAAAPARDPFAVARSLNRFARRGVFQPDPAPEAGA